MSARRWAMVSGQRWPRSMRRTYMVTAVLGALAGSARIAGDRRLLTGRRYSRRSTLRAGAASFAAAALIAAEHRVTRAQSATPTVASPIPDSGDFSGLVDIGGRKLYLECHGTGSPTVVLVAGGRSSARYWTDDLLHPDAPRTMVMPEVAEFTRVCAYDRPGTYAEINDELFPSRSDAIPQPRTVTGGVESRPRSWRRRRSPARTCSPAIPTAASWRGCMPAPTPTRSLVSFSSTRMPSYLRTGCRL